MSDVNVVQTYLSSLKHKVVIDIYCNYFVYNLLINVMTIVEFALDPWYVTKLHNILRVFSFTFLLLPPMSLGKFKFSSRDRSPAGGRLGGRRK